MDLFERAEPILHSRDLLPRPPSLPVERIRLLTGIHKRVQKRQQDTDSSAPETSGDNDTTPVIIGVVIPVLIIAIILFVVWKRRQNLARRQGHEKYQSLDYGVDESALLEKKGRKKLKNGPEMTTTELTSSGRQRGISMDLGPANPYLLPPEVASSRESIHSLSRSINTGDDKYRATTFVPDDGSIRSPSSHRNGRDDTSSWTGSSHLQQSRKSSLPRKSQLGQVDSPRVSKPASIVSRPQTGVQPPLAPGMEENPTMSTNTVNTKSAHTNPSYVDPESMGEPNLPQLDTNHRDSHTPSINAPSPVEQLQEVPAIYAPDERPKRHSSFYEPEPVTAKEEAEELEDMDYSYLAHYQEEEAPSQHQQEPTIPEIRTTDYELDHPQHPNGHPPFNPPHQNRNRDTSQARQRNPPRMQHHDDRNRDDSRIRQRMPPQTSRDLRYRESSQNRQKHASQRPDHRGQMAPPNMQKRPPPPRQDFPGHYPSRPNSDMPLRASNRPPAKRLPPQREEHNSQQTSRTNSEAPPTPTTLETQKTPQTPLTQYDDDDDYSADLGDYAAYIGYSYRTSMIRPLPPDDPTENPEQRANRIRSFYKEYFDESSGGSGSGQGRQTGYYDGSEVYDMYGDYRRGSDAYWSGRNRAMSHGSFAIDGGPRSYSSMSGRFGRPNGGPKKKLPPPKPLMILPSAHKLKDTDFLPNAIDFAPPQIFKSQRSGTPDSMKGGLIPYASGLKAHVPLTSSYDDLAIMPSP